MYAMKSGWLDFYKNNWAEYNPVILTPVVSTDHVVCQVHLSPSATKKIKEYFVVENKIIIFFSSKLHIIVCDRLCILTCSLVPRGVFYSAVTVLEVLSVPSHAVLSDFI